MKKFALISALILMLSACSLPGASNILSSLATPTQLPSATNTTYIAASDTPTLTATLSTPTFTGTPTLMGGGFTATPTLTATSATETPNLTESPMDTPTVIIGTPLGKGFTAVNISGNVLHWGACDSSIIFTAHVADPTNEVAVLLFLRLSSPTTGELTKWEAGAIMTGDNTGMFTYTVTPKNVSHIDEYPNGFLQYQFVALDVHLNHVGYTQPYLNSIAVSRCP
jgi:hypothetical protein